MSIAVLWEIFNRSLEHFWYVSITLSQEIVVDIELGLGLVRSLVCVESTSHGHGVAELFCGLVVSWCEESLCVSHVFICFHWVEVQQIFQFIWLFSIVWTQSHEVVVRLGSKVVVGSVVESLRIVDEVFVLWECSLRFVHVASGSAVGIGRPITTSSTSFWASCSECSLVWSLWLWSANILGLLQEIVESISHFCGRISILLEGIVLVIGSGTCQSIVRLEVSINLFVLVLVARLLSWVGEDIIWFFKTWCNA